MLELSRRDVDDLQNQFRQALETAFGIFEKGIIVHEYCSAAPEMGECGTVDAELNNARGVI